MKRNALLFPCLLALVLCSFPALTWAQAEIAIEEDNPTPQKQEPSAPVQVAPSTSATTQEDQGDEVEVEDDQGTEEAAPAPKPKKAVVVDDSEDSEDMEEAPSGGMVAMYEAGIKAYKRKEYRRAITLLAKAAETKDRTAPKYYYAEAHAMLGVIFQYYVVDRNKACRHYRLALKIDPKTRTASKHLRQVCR